MFKKCLPMFNLHSRRNLHKLTEFDWSKQEKILMEPFEYIQKVPSKYHKLMATTFDHWLIVPKQKLDGIQEAMQTMMTWTILLDDIQDSSAYRYGVASAHEVFGVGLTINAANKALSLGQKQIEDLGHPLAPVLLKKVLDEFFYGQGSDIHWRDNYICPTEQAHLEMVEKKSGSWFALPVELMQLFSANETDYSNLANYIGTYYHILDDYFNLFHPKALETLANITQVSHLSTNDITESKLTLAIIHALQFPDVATELADILKLKTTDPKLQNRAISLVKKHGSDEYMREKLKSMEGQIRAKIDEFGGNTILTQVMDDLSLY